MATETTETDRELKAIDVVLRALAPLTPEQKARVIWYTSRRYNLPTLVPQSGGTGAGGIGGGGTVCVGAVQS